MPRWLHPKRLLWFLHSSSWQLRITSTGKFIQLLLRQPDGVTFESGLEPMTCAGQLILQDVAWFIEVILDATWSSQHVRKLNIWKDRGRYDKTWILSTVNGSKCSINSSYCQWVSSWIVVIMSHLVFYFGLCAELIPAIQVKNELESKSWPKEPFNPSYKMARFILKHGPLLTSDLYSYWKSA